MQVLTRSHVVPKAVIFTSLFPRKNRPLHAQSCRLSRWVSPLRFRSLYRRYMYTDSEAAGQNDIYTQSKSWNNSSVYRLFGVNCQKNKDSWLIISHFSSRNAARLSNMRIRCVSLIVNWLFLLLDWLSDKTSDLKALPRALGNYNERFFFFTILSISRLI